MFVSMNWIKEYVDFGDQDVVSLIKRFTLSTAEVEDIYYKGQDVQGVIVAEITSVEPHPNSKKLHLLKVNTGKEVVDVVCGAPNVAVGQRVAFAPVGSHVVGMEIGAAQVAGYTSYGMCCGEDELGISDDHSGLMAIDVDCPLGTDIKSIYDIDDIIFEVDNKSLTNRPDLWGHYGIAREFSVLIGTELKPMNLLEPVYNGNDQIEVNINRPDLAYRYTCCSFKNITRKVSPTNWRIRLYYCGMRAISLLVDLTNLIMMEVGQPTHAFDGTGIKSITIDTPKEDFKFKTLDEVERNIDKDTLMIYTNDKPSAIAGIMGGLESEIEGTSNSTVLECAAFNGVSVRKSTVRLCHRTDASMRYEKMLDPELTMTACYRFWALLKEADAGAEVASKITDKYVKKYDTLTIDIDKAYIDRYTGIDIPADTMYNTLTKLGFGVDRNGDSFHVTVPSWRATKDVSLKADLVEEVSRIYGYDNFAITSTASLLKPVRSLVSRDEDNRVKDLLVKRYSMHEVHSYIWFEGKELFDIGIEVEDNPKLLNTVTPENSVLRNSMLPTMLTFAYENKSYADAYSIFEIGRVVDGTKEDGTCNERRKLGAVIYNRNKTEKEAYFDAVEIIRTMVSSIKHSEVSFAKAAPTHKWQHPKNTSDVMVNGVKLGTLCTLHPFNAQKIDKNAAIICFEIDMQIFNELKVEDQKFRDISKFPAIDYDISLILPKSSSFNASKAKISAMKVADLADIQVIDVYELETETSVTVRFTFSAFDKTLAMDDVQNSMKTILAELEKDGIKARL